MGLLQAFEDLCATEGPIGEIATQVGESLFECGHSIADALDEFAEKLGRIETDHAGEEGSSWAVDRLDPEFEKTPGLRALRNAVDSIVSIGEGLADKINDATMKLETGE